MISQTFQKTINGEIRLRFVLKLIRQGDKKHSRGGETRNHLHIWKNNHY